MNKQVTAPKMQVKGFIIMTEAGKYLSILKGVPFFKQLADDDICSLASLLQIETFSRGEILFMEGDTGKSLYVLIDGLIKLSKLNEEGKEQILHYVHPGSIFAEVVLFDGGPYPATAEAAEDSRVGILHNRDMEKLILTRNELALGMLKIMSRRLRAAQLTIRDLALHDADRRLARLLFKLADRHGKSTSRGLKLDTWITRQEMASIIGTTRETVARILSRYQKEGYLSIHKGAIFLQEDFIQEMDPLVDR